MSRRLSFGDLQPTVSKSCSPQHLQTEEKMYKLKMLLLASALSLGTAAAFAQANSTTGANKSNDAAVSGAVKGDAKSGSVGANVNANDANTKAKDTNANANPPKVKANANASIKSKARKHKVETTGSGNAKIKMKTPDGPGTGGPSNRASSGASNKLDQ
jgi:hypothetical protein